MLESALTELDSAAAAVLNLGVAALAVAALIGLFFLAIRFIESAGDSANEADRRLDRAQHAWMDQQDRKLKSHDYDSNARPRGYLP